MGIRLIKISVVYFMIGVLFGLYMSMTHDYSFTPVHAHINLLGWTALTLAGIIYHLFPAVSQTKLAKAHFWLHNIGLPLMMIGLFYLISSGNEGIIPVIAAGGVLTTLAVLLFGYNVLTKLKAE
ncbi:cytochrome c oxidase [[Bacillus] enclensis]|jgi:cbb3-type cytochrome oxidase subunit 1|uniref:Cytochrome C and Quinol oxidase polypeptide I n=1 Tax=[Bacillus] enclensis TaxID=1402860 RepID=A0A0V8H879_9BACI|nr:cbb3-type cytochrome c oxidase subunit I [[Bacillus] enclensis]KSU58731.1 cytochrome c oxidase [[Bacillus] enclensis]MBH9965834.1 cbb3-type cytochrome c oxidase subunit I [[Bacillus] enclensis]QTC40129.1 cbb3-type cytochrome c oxidase subunit I [Bacillus sp. V3]SCC33677.1 Cytochrome C and Quinol oxidase polypeptide I [[Bacillus] enclensis]